MGKFSLKVSTDKDAVKDSAGGAYIRESGVYDVKINFVSLEESDTGVVRFNMNIDYNGQSKVIYGANLTNKDGSDNAIGRRLINSLLVIAGLEDGQDPDIQVEEHKVGKDNEIKEFDVITDLSDLGIKIQLKQEFSVYNKAIRESLVIYKFFRDDGASAEECVEQRDNPDYEVGKQLAATLEREGTTKPIYKGNNGTNEAAPTEAEVKAWLAQKSKTKGGKGPAPKATTKAKSKSPFAK